MMSMHMRGILNNNNKGHIYYICAGHESVISHHMTSPRGSQVTCSDLKKIKVTAAPVFIENSQIPAPCLSNSFGEFRLKKPQFWDYCLRSFPPDKSACVDLRGESEQLTFVS